MPARNSKFVSSALLIGLAVVILVVLIAQYKYRKDPKKAGYENFERELALPPTQTPSPQLFNNAPAINSASIVQQEGVVQPSEPLNMEDYKAVDFQVENKIPSTCYPRDKTTAEDLLPKNAANSLWAQNNPAGQGDVKDQNFLTAGYLMGIDTQMSSLKNANLQLRSDPQVPKIPVGPWSQSTIDPDTSRRYFEINSC